jgi:hypothetical protein
VLVVGKLREFGVAIGAIGFPMPDNGIEFVNPDKVSVTVRVAVRTPNPDGVKAMPKLTLSVAPIMVFERLPVTAKSVAFNHDIENASATAVVPVSLTAPTVPTLEK